MGQVERYPNGTFCWIDLGTTDVPGAKAFYGGLFGWEFADQPATEAGTYTVCRIDGKDVAGMYEQAEAQGWGSFISVDEVDQATSRARKLGAAVLAEPVEVPGDRVSVLRDPSGAVVSLSQPKGNIGAKLVNEVGTWSWNELVTADLDAARAFYGELFGWTAEAVPGPIPRTSFTLDGLLIGGGHAPIGPEDPTPRWSVAFRVADADQSAARVQELGGTVLLPPMDIPVGRFAIVADRGGAAFSVGATPGGPARGVDGS
jgi:predicted enzyme related to lactoylglutathione lyase